MLTQNPYEGIIFEVLTEALHSLIIYLLLSINNVSYVNEI